MKKEVRKLEREFTREKTISFGTIIAGFKELLASPKKSQETEGNFSIPELNEIGNMAKNYENQYKWESKAHKDKQGSKTQNSFKTNLNEKQQYSRTESTVTKNIVTKEDKEREL